MRSLEERRSRSTTNEINDREIDNRKKLTSLVSFSGVLQSFRKSWYSCMLGDAIYLGKYQPKSHKGNSVDLQTLLMTCIEKLKPCINSRRLVGIYIYTVRNGAEVVCVRNCYAFGERNRASHK